MKTFLASVSLTVLLIANAQSGSSSDFAKGITTSQADQSWYADREFNVQLWGTYLFTGNDYFQDSYLRADHAWGGGIGAKYFFNRYMAVGVEGYVAATTITRTYFTFFIPVGDSVVTVHDTQPVGAALATFTLRYPVGTSRIAPYVFAGAGAITGGQRRLIIQEDLGAPPGTNPFHASFTDGETEAIGQFGGGLEIRLTPHLGIINDFSWNVVNWRVNNFGMVRAGINLAF
jgi:hypothetical protein